MLCVAFVTTVLLTFFSELTWCCIILPTYSPSHLLPNDIFFVSFSHSSRPPHASVHWQYIILLSASVFLVFFFSFTFVCMLLKCHYDWGAHARKCHKIGHLQMRKKTDLFLGVFLSVSECNFENTQMTWVFAMVQSTAFFIYDLRKLRMQNFLLTITESCRKRCRVITHGCLCICCRSTMQQPE